MGEQAQDFLSKTVGFNLINATESIAQAIYFFVACTFLLLMLS